MACLRIIEVELVELDTNRIVASGDTLLLFPTPARLATTINNLYVRNLVAYKILAIEYLPTLQSTEQTLFGLLSHSRLSLFDSGALPSLPVS